MQYIVQCSVFFNPFSRLQFAGSKCPGLVYLEPKGLGEGLPVSKGVGEGEGGFTY